MPTDADSLTWFPSRDLPANSVNAPSHFVARHPRILKAGPQALFDEHIAMANPARFDFHTDLPAAGFRDIALHEFKWAARFS
jgi:hypothetical protein